MQCCETDERGFNPNTVKYIPSHYVWKSYPHTKPSYYQYRPAVPINNQYVPYPYHAKPVSVRPHAQIPQLQVLPNLYPLTVVHHSCLHPSLIASPPKKIQDKTDIPTINNIAAVEPTRIPTSEPIASTVLSEEASSEFITSTPESITVTLTTPIA